MCWWASRWHIWCCTATANLGHHTYLVLSNAHYVDGATLVVVLYCMAVASGHHHPTHALVLHGWQVQVEVVVVVLTGG